MRALAALVLAAAGVGSLVVAEVATGDAASAFGTLETGGTAQTRGVAGQALGEAVREGARAADPLQHPGDLAYELPRRFGTADDDPQRSDDTVDDEPQPLFRTPQPAEDGRPARLPRAEELACNACHAELVEEWATSLHAQAWIDERYQEALAGRRRPESCTGCHIPQPLFDGALERRYVPRDDVTTPRPADGPEALAWDPRHMGISCVSCHRAPDGAMLGPFASDTEDELSEAHASRQHPAFVRGSEAQDALCITCHRQTVGPVIGIAKGYQQTDQAAKGLSCVGCHFAPVERAHAKGTRPDGSTWESPIRPGRSHALQTPRDPYYLSLAFGLEAAATETGAQLTIRNQAAHRIPGLRTRTMRFVVTARAADGTTLAETEHTIASDAPLDIDGTIPLPLSLATPATTLHVQAWHDWEGIEAPVLFLDRELEL